MSTASRRSGVQALALVAAAGDEVTGLLDNEPDSLPNLDVGSVIRVKQARNIDWLIVSDDRQYGHFTTRVMLKHDPKSAAQWKDRLSADPLPPAFKNSAAH